MVFRVQIMLVAGVTSIVIAVLAMLAAFVPQWFLEYPNALTLGLGKTCVQAAACQNTNYNTAGSTVICQSGTAWHDRESSIAALIWISIVIEAILLLLTALAVAGKLTFQGTCQMVSLAVVSGVTPFFVMIGLAVYGDMMQTWLFCGGSFCQVFGAGRDNDDCGYGSSFICVVVAFFFSLAALICYIIHAINEAGDKRPVLRKVITGCLAFTVLLLFIGVITNRWIAISSDPVSHGMFSTCSGSSCSSNDYSNWQYARGSTPTCRRDGTEFSDRNSTTGVFYILACVVYIVLAVLFLMTNGGQFSYATMYKLKIPLCVVAGFGLLFEFIGFVVFAATWNSWLLCGVSFCDRYTCNYGFSFVCAVMAMILSLLLLVLLITDAAGCLQSHIIMTTSGGDPYTQTSTHTQGSGARTTTSSSYRKTTTTTTTTSRSSAGRSASRGRDDWEYDSNSGFYWSDSRQVFWDKASNQHYDPATKKWTAAR
jgi:hypothetical protein